jgi:urate oxidase
LHSFASGVKPHYYGKGDVIVYRLNRDGRAPANQSPVFGANVTLLIYGRAFWPTYASGDNTGLIATDSMKNFIQRETLRFHGGDLEGYCRFLGDHFLKRYGQVEGLQITADEIPYDQVDSSTAFAPGGPQRAMARLEMTRSGIVEAVSGLRGFKGLRLTGSAFRGFVRDEYTMLPDLPDRPLHMWLDIEWGYARVEDAFSDGRIANEVRRVVWELFRTFESGSIQQVIYQIGTRVLAALPAISRIDLEANNRAWDTIAERGLAVGVYTDARPPYGILGLRLTRES